MPSLTLTFDVADKDEATKLLSILAHMGARNAEWTRDENEEVE